ncbi:hypothetical protein DSL64_04360 [Dyadobacter luteus]|jgi:predicted TIM-barrel fold metal-dependent hydrolase|uniref:Uncharacterized protein n=1 Tax=Dyadobacter luteus TaxID=2259619 RepID=A0A3D8YGI8_9BACT|nr:amidohydrolase family protein [Dyadobacter luteus]REA63674.1 hypothetical protein DSL64_04360 [Dyadobacter luteus]
MTTDPRHESVGADSKHPVINCHTHIFTSDYVPPHLAKTFIPEPLHRIFSLGWLVPAAKWWFNSNSSPYKWPYQRWYILLIQTLYRIRIGIARSRILSAVKFVVGLIIAASIFYELKKLYFPVIESDQHILFKAVNLLTGWLESAGMLIITNSWFLKSVLLILLLTFFPSGRNLLIFLMRRTIWFFKILPGKQTFALISRYINIVMLARYKDQFRIFSRLRSQYPKGSAMVVLPMDMEYMKAGKPIKSYETQMKELARVKANHKDFIYPFIFVDPRRITDERSVESKELFFDYEIQDNKVKLRPCFIKTYIEVHKFSGFKIYPALGYHVFDERLLALWKYAADNNLPIMTHCIRGTIFYRGDKKKDWDQHPVFEQYEGNQDDTPSVAEHFRPLLFKQTKPIDVQEIFTHPMNYACLLKREWLAVIVAKSQDPKVKQLFGYDQQRGTISCGLEELKICFGHFGGEDEWLKYFERDRDSWGQQLQRYPLRGISFISENGKTPDRRKPEKLWKYADWYSLICSMMLQHPNVYADISYILHDTQKILPLLKQTLCHPELRRKVLYGTDFYVVRNHKSDKQMLAEMMNGLSTEEFDQIARLNPRTFLNLKI